MLKKMDERLSIGKVAKRAGVGVETVRFYEREGLIEEPARLESSYRQYEPDVVGRLRFIRHAKTLGFTLREIKELLELRADPTSTCTEVKEQAEQKIQDIDEKIATLQKMKSALVSLTEACEGEGAVSACPILDALEDEDLET